MAADQLNAVVAQRIEVSPGLIILRVVPEGWTPPPFESGQFAVLGLPASAPRFRFSDPEDEPPPPEKMIKRAYSIASTSVVPEYLEFYVTLVTSGALTPRLFELRSGDRLHLGPRITGSFTLQDVPGDCNVVMVATGTGLAPYMSMMRSRLVCGAPRRFALIHGARHSWDLGYRSELITLVRLCANFNYIPVISRPGEEPIAWSGRTGYVQDIWNARVVDEMWGLRVTPESTHILLCGNPAMIEHMEQVLAAEGFKEHRRKEPGQVHSEKYW
ncbi:MAG: ferredoxin--NADP reductase [Acidobacteria bacterium]|nr:ferredoxin--NADP reductase [Acidobacteriota bacterium]